MNSNGNKKGYSDKLFFKENSKSEIIKTLMQGASLSQSDVAEYLNCTLSSLRNKFTRDSFSLYDFIVVCYVCGYSFAIVEDDGYIDIAKECVDSAINYIDTEESDTDAALEDLLVAQENLEGYEYIFDLSPENVLTEDEFQRIQSLMEEKRKSKYEKILDGMSKNDQMTILQLLEERQKKNFPSDK